MSPGLLEIIFLFNFEKKIYLSPYTKDENKFPQNNDRFGTIQKF